MSEEDDIQLVNPSLIELLLSEIVIPGLYSPIDKLDRFLKENTHLFTLFGVFGAVSIYLDTVQEHIETENEVLGGLTLFTGFSIVILISSIIFVKILVQVRKSNSILLSIENWGLISFSILFSR